MGSPNIKGKITLRGKFDKFVTTFIVKRVDYLIVKSINLGKQIKSKSPIEVIPNGVDFDFFKPEKREIARKRLELNNDDFVVLFLGNPLETRKNIKLAKESLELLQSNAKCKVTFLNPYGIAPSEIVTYMNSADVLLLTSFWEGSPNVIKEAMACNLPIISTDVGDVKNVIAGAHNCFIISFDKGSIVDKLSIVKNNRERSNGREKIRHLSDEIIAKRISNIYEKILSNN